MENNALLIVPMEKWNRYEQVLEKMENFLNDLDLKKEPEMVDSDKAREILGTHGRVLSKSRFNQLKRDGKVNTYGFGAKHFYNVQELENLKRK